MIVLEEKKDQLAQKPDDIVEATDAASVAQGVVDDHVDIQNAQTENREQLSNKSKSLFRIGPGLITGVADDDPSGIGTYSVAGAAVRLPASLAGSRVRAAYDRRAGDVRPRCPCDEQGTVRHHQRALP